jgi:hypothetical protein
MKQLSLMRRCALQTLFNSGGEQRPMRRLNGKVFA